MREGWHYKRLGEVCDVMNGLWVGKKEPFINIAVIRNTNFSKDCRLKLDDVAFIDAEERQFASRKLHYGDIIVEKSGGSDKQPVGRAVLFDIDEGNYSFSNFTSALRVKEGANVLPSFLHKCLYAYYIKGETFKMQSKTTGLHNLDMKAYLRLSIPFLPLPEQERIVAELDLLSGIIDKYKQELKELDTLAQSIFYDMFGDPVANEKGWVQQTLSSLCEKLFAGGDVPKERCTKEKNEAYRVPVLTNGVGEKSIYGYTDEAKVFEESITISGRGTIGYCAVRREPYFPAIRLIVAIPNKSIILPRFLKSVIDALKFEGAGVAIPQLTIPMIKNRAIIVPPIAQQSLFSCKIDEIEKQKEVVEEAIREAEVLFNSRMDYYFN